MNVVMLIFAVSLAGKSDMASARYFTMAECEGARYRMLEIVRGPDARKPMFRQVAVLCVELTKLTES